MKNRIYVNKNEFALLLALQYRLMSDLYEHTKSACDKYTCAICPSACKQYKEFQALTNVLNKIT